MEQQNTKEKEEIEDSRNQTRGEQAIILPLDKDEYKAFIDVNKTKNSRKLLLDLLEIYPELFPLGMNAKNWRFYGTRGSAKTDYRVRVIGFENKYYRLYPCFLMPYMREYDEAMGNALLLSRYGVPLWLITKLYGKNVMYWSRVLEWFGECSLVGSTVKDGSNLPEHIIVDEKHTKLNGKKHYIATTVGEEVILGAECCSKANEDCLTKAYGVFAKEARNIWSKYCPKSYNTDGWDATKKAMKALYSKALHLLCFLHAFIAVRTGGQKKHRQDFSHAAEMIWDAYRSEMPSEMLRKLAALKKWAYKLADSKMKDKILKLCAKRKYWIWHYSYEKGHRTSNMLDRLMRQMDRRIFMMLNFRGGQEKASSFIRAFALILNYAPFAPQTVKKNGGLTSRAHRLNNKLYHKEWHKNMLIATSLRGFHHFKTNP